jgi:hypothetical protein
MLWIRVFLASRTRYGMQYASVIICTDLDLDPSIDKKKFFQKLDFYYF